MNNWTYCTYCTYALYVLHTPARTLKSFEGTLSLHDKSYGSIPLSQYRHELQVYPQGSYIFGGYVRTYNLCVWSSLYVFLVFLFILIAIYVWFFLSESLSFFFYLSNVINELCFFCFFILICIFIFFSHLFYHSFFSFLVILDVWEISWTLVTSSKIVN